MRAIKPFCAVRPVASIANEFCTNPLTLYSEKEVRKILKSNSKSFLQIIRDNIDYNKEISFKHRLTKIHHEYQRFKSNGFLIKDKRPGFYIKEITKNEEKITGIIATVPVMDYKNGKIKIHENTIPSRENKFKDYLKITRFNSEPVLLAYESQNPLKNLIEKIKQLKPTSEINFSENEVYKLWYINDKNELLNLINEFNKIPNFYIADGHHRSASSKLLHNDEKNSGTDSFMAYLVPENELKIKEFNRTVTDLNGHTCDSFLKEIKSKFDVKTVNNYNCKKNGFYMYLNGQFYFLSLLKQYTNPNSPLDQLDAYVLQEKILKPILGIKNVRTDKRLGYSHKSDSMESIKKDINEGKIKVGFGLRPISIDQLKIIADLGLVMPPKTSYIYPKLRSGVTIFEF